MSQLSQLSQLVCIWEKRAKIGLYLVCNFGKSGLMVLSTLENLENLEKSGNFVVVRENLENLEKSGNFVKISQKNIFSCFNYWTCDS